MELATVELINACYRLLLGREAESADVISEAILQTPDNLIDGFLNSDEFRTHAQFAFDEILVDFPSPKVSNVDLALLLGHLPLDPRVVDDLNQSFNRRDLVRAIVTCAPLRNRANHLKLFPLVVSPNIGGSANKRARRDISAVDLLAYFDLPFILRDSNLDFPTCEEAIEAYFALPIGRRFRTSPAFSPTLYFMINSDLVAGEIDALLHYVTCGIDEGRSPHPLFDKSSLLPEHDTENMPYDVYAYFLSGAIDKSCNILLDVEVISSQVDRPISARDAFFAVCDERSSLTVSPNAIFSPYTYRYRAKNRALENELIDYVVFKRSGAVISDIFDQQYYVAGLSQGTQGLLPAEHYLMFWSSWSADISTLVDVKHLNHQLSLIGKPSDEEPLRYMILKNVESSSAILHPHVHSPTLRHCFQNIPTRRKPNDLTRLSDVVTGTLKAIINRDAQEAVVLSIIILNYYKPAYTILSVLAALNATASFAAEIVVIENGGDLLQFEASLRIFSAVGNVRIVKMDENKFFGEGNNIGIDLTSGKYILFLNNDCILCSTFGDAFLNYREAHDFDVLGALLLFPDLSIQEFGGLVSECGQVIQRYKHLPLHYVSDAPIEQTTDYSSAACLIVSRRACRVVGGFDPHFEPFYYEDTDLCMRLRRAGYHIAVSRELMAIHFENASTREFLRGDKFFQMISDHKAKFSRRWLLEQGRGAFIDAEATFADNNVPSSILDKDVRKLAVFYTPFHIRAGGGERYFFTAAYALARTHRIVICTEKTVSSARIRFTLHSLGIPSFPFEVLDKRTLFGRARDVDVFFVISNEIAPTVPAIGRASLYHIQFPFPWRNAGVFNFGELGRYDRIIVNSAYTKHWTEVRLSQVGVRKPPPVEIIYPPVRQIRRGNQCLSLVDDHPIALVSVGRFFVGGHSKRQDIFVAIVKRLRTLIARRVVGTLIGSIHPSDEAAQYFKAVKDEADQAGDIKIVVDASQEELDESLRSAHFYVHCAGYKIQPDAQPEAAEHFGIAVAEAIYAGCVPVVYNLAGPREIVDNVQFGIRYLSIDDAASKIADIVRSGMYQHLRDSADLTWLARTNVKAFSESLHDVVATVASRPFRTNHVGTQSNDAL